VTTSQRAATFPTLRGPARGAVRPTRLGVRSGGDSLPEAGREDDEEAYIVAGAILVLAYLAGRVAFRSGAFDWEKMFQRMPDTARRSGCSTTSKPSARTQTRSWSG
jgi:hypothetical protein